MTIRHTSAPDMYLAPPGFSLTSFIMNVPQLQWETGTTPVVIDRYDWDRLRGRIVTRLQGDIDSPHQSHSQRLGLMLTQLRQQGLIRCVDYREYYPQSIQRRNIAQIRAVLSSLDTHEKQQAAVAAAKGYGRYGFGSYQESLRRTLDNLDQYLDSRKRISKEADRLSRGVGDEDLWLERVMNQHMAALSVRQSLERKRGVTISCLGQNEIAAVASLIDDPPSKQLPPTLRDIDGTLTDTAVEFDIDDTTKHREVADQISKIAQEIVGIDNDHWFVFGPRLAMVESGDTYTRARSYIRFGSAESIASEAEQLLSRLNDRREENRSAEFINHEAEWLAEQNQLDPIERRHIVNQLRAETRLSNYSRDLKALGSEYSDGAKAVVESVVMDPVNNYVSNDIFKETIDLLRTLEPTTMTDEQLESFLYRGSFRVGYDDWDWYQDPQRQPSIS